MNIALLFLQCLEQCCSIGSGTVLCLELNGMTQCCLYQLEGSALSMELSITGIGNVFQCMQHNVFDAIGKPSVKNQTLENRSSLINRYMYKVRKLSLSNAVVAFPVTSILQQCVHVPVKHSETDLIILQPNPFEHH